MNKPKESGRWSPHRWPPTKIRRYVRHVFARVNDVCATGNPFRLDKADSSFEAKLLPPETALDEQRAFVLLVKAYKLLEGIRFFGEE